MGFSCRCGAVYADSDVAKFMQHVQKCSGGSKSGAGERAQPTPRGVVGRKSSPAISAKSSGDGNDGNAIICPECGESFTRRTSLKRHVVKQHPKKDVDDIMDRASKNPNSKCPHCNEFYSAAHMQRHIGRCPVLKASQKPQARPNLSGVPRGVQRASGSQDLNVSRDSLVERAENLDLCQPMALMTDDQFLNKFKAFMTDEKSTGHVKESTVKNYMIYIKNYGSYWKNENPNFSFGKLCLFGSDDCLEPPSAEFWEPRLGKADSRNGGISAFIKMVDFLSSELRRLKALGKISKPAFRDHQSDLIAVRQEANGLLDRVQRLKPQEKNKRDRQRERLAESDADRVIPGPELERILKAYGGCDYRTEMYSIIGGDLEDALKRNEVTPTAVRDFVLFECIFVGTGSRNDAICNMRIREMLNHTPLEGGKKVCIEVEDHKTANTYGAARDLMPIKTYKALHKYYQFARPLIFQETKNHGDEFVFVAGGKNPGTKYQTPFALPDRLLKKGSSFEYHITPYTIRHHVATEAQGSSDAQVREMMPGHMGHSQTTALGTYRTTDAKRAEHSRMQDKVNTWNTSGEDLPDVDLDEAAAKADKDRVIRQEREEHNQEKAAQEQRVHANRPKRKAGEKFMFSPDDRKIVKNAFLFALDSDGNPRATITSYPGLKMGQKSDFHRAYNGDQVFRQMVDRIMEEEGFDMKEMKTKIMNTYRALHRGKPGNTSASTSGTSRGQASKPKKRRRVVESESEESDESNDSEDFSDEEFE